MHDVNEKKVMWVVLITTLAMAGEITAGILTNSMALLGDGIHMASHSLALGLSWIAYVLVRKNRKTDKFLNGPEKILSLSGYTSGLLLAVFALGIGYQSVMRLINPTEILYNEALIVAIAGLIVNLVSVFILHQDEEHSDHNQKAAYLHVLADLLTSLAAIAGLLAAKYFRLVWVDPVVGLLGMVLILRWSWSLLSSTAKTLVDYRENKQTDISKKT